ncbi:M14 family metallopeptidase [Pedomonas mirosovicensis]|uniref:M14 family metallopeptidase n=1 Tax=Pedomonas mirosovicensis TaxID=2908641 RepID=UPI0021693966|nr:M14-type cytosolic carboxypeptidase [Pedomonas mirosovicensis]MCH8684703.1 M14-type cytosolic carboxypeptidase [Pedomonas mirosovicensis]
MALRVSANFDSGNIEVLSIDSPENIRLSIRRDHNSDFYQWFHFRLTGAAGVPCTITIVNAGGSAYPDGWPGYQARVSEDRMSWTQAETSYANGELTIHYTPIGNSVWFAYFAPYSMERHHDLIAEMAQEPGVDTVVLGQTLDGQDLDLVRIGEPSADKRNVWVIARQHPGETMAEWAVEGMLRRLTDLADPVTKRLREKCVFYIVPNMNPDGSRRGHLRTNAAGVNLNREWDTPTMERSPEVLLVRNHMDAVGCDFCLDVHGDEALPHNFIAGFEGVLEATEHQFKLLERYKTTLARITPDFQTRVGYVPSKPGEANMSMSTNAIAGRYKCLAMTLEMPFKDAAENPDPVHGWSPERCQHLGRSCLDALLELADNLR